GIEPAPGPENSERSLELRPHPIPRERSAILSQAPVIDNAEAITIEEAMPSGTEPLGLSPARVLALGPHLSKRGVPAAPLGRYAIASEAPTDAARALIDLTRDEVVRELAPELLEAYLDTIADGPNDDPAEREASELLLAAAVTALRAACRQGA